MKMRGITAEGRLPKTIELLLTIADTDNSLPVGRNNTLNRTERRLEKVRIFCSCNYAREITLDKMAAYIGMSKSSFCTFMCRHTGMSLTEFVNEIRLERAMDMLLHTDKSITAIAYDVGYANVTYFNRLFRDRYKCTPTSIRICEEGTCR